MENCRNKTETKPFDFNWRFKCNDVKIAPCINYMLSNCFALKGFKTCPSNCDSKGT
jgi:hypothetical protein